jgi:hypothetical protein
MMFSGMILYCYLPDCFASYLAIPRNDDDTLRHPQGEAIQRTRMDCFTLRMTGATI